MSFNLQQLQYQIDDLKTLLTLLFLNLVDHHQIFGNQYCTGNTSASSLSTKQAIDLPVLIIIQQAPYLLHSSKYFKKLSLKSWSAFCWITMLHLLTNTSSSWVDQIFYIQVVNSWHVWSISIPIFNTPTFIVLLIDYQVQGCV